MIFDVLIATIGGLLGTTVMTGMMLFGTQVGLPAIDVHGLLGYITNADHRTGLGYISHWALGVVFALLYVPLFRLLPVTPVVLGALFGVIHWVIVGWMFAFAPMIHAGMKAGTVKQPGAFMLKSLGMIGFIGGLIGHIVFGVTVALVFVWLG